MIMHVLRGLMMTTMRLVVGMMEEVVVMTVMRMTVITVGLMMRIMKDM